MKRLKKICALLVCLSMAVMLIPSVVHAAGAELRFSDPSTTVGAEVEVTARLTADTNLDTVNATLTYDTASLRFVSGDGVTANGNQLFLQGSGGSTTSELSWSMHFQALAEGTTRIEVSAASGFTSEGYDLEVVKGNSTITIGPGDPSLIQDTASAASGGSVDINGISYSFSGDFSDALVPEGFTKTEMSYEGQNYPAAIQESSGKYIVYLKNPEGAEDFFLYDPDNGIFSPFYQISISTDRFIILLSEDMSKELPTNLQKTSLMIEGKEFPAWQNIDNAEYYVVYALNSDGKKGFYQYDTIDGTYQRYTVEKEVEEKESSSFLGGLVDKLRDNLDKAIIGVWCVFLFMLIILIIVSVKLRHRNLELDDLYDEYGIDLDDEEEDIKPSKKDKKDKKDKKSKAASKKKKTDEDDFYDFDDEDSEYDDDDGYEDDDYELDDYEEDESEDDAFEAYDYNMTDYSGDDSDIDDLDALLNARVKEPAKRPNKTTPRRVGHMDPDDTFKMDIIDLD